MLIALTILGIIPILGGLFELLFFRNRNRIMAIAAILLITGGMAVGLAIVMLMTVGFMDYSVIFPAFFGIPILYNGISLSMDELKEMKKLEAGF